MELLKNYKKELNKLNELKKLDTSDKTNKIKILLQKDNTKIALFEDIAETLVEVWNKYANKPLGEQTRKKIQNEIETKFDNNIFCYIANDYYYCNEKITITTRDETKKFTGETKIEITSNNPNFRLVNTENKIQELKTENLRESDAKTKIKNLDATTNKIIKLHETAKKLQEQLNAIHSEIGQISNHKIQSVQYTNTVRHWII